MVDRRPPGFNVDLGFAYSREVMSIPARYRNAAIGLWVRAGAWSADKLTDGHVPGEVLRSLGATPTVVKFLIESTLWKSTAGADVAFTNWPRWQRTRSEILLYRQTEAARKRSARSGRNAPTSDDPEMSARTTDGRSQNVRLDVRPESGNPKTEIRDKERGNVSPVGCQRAETDYPDHCPTHRYDPDPPPCGACRRQRIDNETAAQQAADIETIKRVADRDKKQSQLTACQQCDEFGWRIDMWGEPIDPATKCFHPGIEQ